MVPDRDEWVTTPVGEKKVCLSKKKGKMRLSSRNFGHFETNLESMTSLNVQYRENMASMNPFISFHMIDYKGISLGLI